MPTPNSSIDVLFATVYDELRSAAHSVRSRNQGDTLNTTLLVHELYLRLRKSTGVEFANKVQFFSYAGRALRSIMVDHARSRIAERARVNDVAVLLASALNPEALSPMQALGLDTALKLLEADDARCKGGRAPFFCRLDVGGNCRAFAIDQPHNRPGLALCPRFFASGVIRQWGIACREKRRCSVIRHN